MEGLTNSMFPQLSILSVYNNNFNCTYLAKLLRTLKWEELGLSIDPELVHSNETHINGIACDHETNDSIAYNRVLNDHYDHQYNVHKAIAILNPTKGTNNHKTDNDDIHELQISHAEEEREHNLEMHLLTMKYLLAFICCICLAFVITKFITIFRAQKQLDYNVAGTYSGIYLADCDKYGIYQSTATVNTIQTNVAY